MKFKQYSVVIVNLDPTVGREIQKTRPCLVVSPDEMNYSTLIIAPLTSKERGLPTRVKLKKDSFVVLDQIRVIPTNRIVGKSKIKLNQNNISQVESILKNMLVD
jgi:mRNA interferase MazF